MAMKQFNLDIIGQPPHLHIYTQLCLCYSLADNSNANATRQSAVDTLAQGLKTLARRIPWLAGQIIHESSTEPGNSGVYKLASWRDAPPLLIRDLRGNPSAPTMQKLRKRNFPMELLDERIIAPYMTIPGGMAGANLDEPTAVFAVQLNHVEGGILVTFVGQHQVMDLVGQVQVMKMLDRVCRGEEIPEAEVEVANRERDGVIPDLRDDEEGPREQLGRQTVKMPPAADMDATRHDEEVEQVVSPAVWASFSFSGQSLAALKAAALETATSKKISTDDTLTAFIFQSITRARYYRLRNDSSATCTLGRAVDARRYLKIPATYPGLLNNMVYHSHSIQEIISIPLGVLASELRHEVDPATSRIGLYTRTLAALLHRTPGKGSISMGANINPSRDIMISSWAGAGVDCYEMDFGMELGVPAAVRRPVFVAVEGLGYLLPKHPSGEILLVICLKEEDMELLKGDEEWRRWTG
ncbi:putative trichothecene 3-O-acetyltransferase [Chaetomium fimeti]|uniref:Trichothecene 3-O-acetyltransferase n=1 Tax=Chaetomium fimeti TaxID=1854472 RepID=A0AAE0HQI4_9PEZI|nr:putative trichothecene 3-O-acetyltransferase [Chaetomium fimeti]